MSVKKGKKTIEQLNIQPLTKDQEKQVKGGSSDGTNGIISMIQPE